MTIPSWIPIGILLVAAISVIVLRKKIWKVAVELIVDFVIMLVLFLVSSFILYALHISAFTIIPAVVVLIVLKVFDKINIFDFVMIGLVLAFGIVEYALGTSSVWIFILFIIGMMALAVINIFELNSGEEDIMRKLAGG